MAGRGRTLAIGVVGALFVAAAGLYLFIREQERSAVAGIEDCLQLADRAKRMAWRTLDLRPPSPRDLRLEERATSAGDLVEGTLELSRELSSAAGAAARGDAAARNLLASLMELSRSLTKYRELLNELDAPAGTLERARETALDAIRILMYNLVDSSWDPAAQAGGKALEALAARCREASARLSAVRKDAVDLASNADAFVAAAVKQAASRAGTAIFVAAMAALVLAALLVLRYRARRRAAERSCRPAAVRDKETTLER